MQHFQSTHVVAKENTSWNKVSFNSKMSKVIILMFKASVVSWATTARVCITHSSMTSLMTRCCTTNHALMTYCFRLLLSRISDGHACPASYRKSVLLLTTDFLARIFLLCFFCTYPFTDITFYSEYDLESFLEFSASATTPKLVLCISMWQTNNKK